LIKKQICTCSMIITAAFSLPFVLFLSALEFKKKTCIYLFLSTTDNPNTER